MKLSKAYEPSQYEPNIYALWEASGAFEPTGKGETYSIVMPPPNANGDLHTGHGLDMNLKDILIRYHRMKGYDSIYIPGADHAGFETWVVYEKELAKTGKSRFDFSREELYQQVWDFVEQKRGSMELQLRALGVSASWTHSTFTLDKKVTETVYETFKRLWDEELVYRGERIVNYCTKHQTSFADIEVEHKTEKSHLWHIAYELTDGGGEVVIATSRPETKLGESALLVHPDDTRYNALIGREVYQPLIPGKPIPIIGDDYVDPQFGTGAVTITPAHDPNDFKLAKKHQLPIIELIDHEGKMTNNVPSQFRGYTILEARKRVIAALEAADKLRKIEDYTHTIGVCYKCGTTIEPLIKSQWFLQVRTLADRAKQAIQSGEITFTPQSKSSLITQYFDNLHDWNLSRQIPWGIPIPAFVNISDTEDWIFDTRVDQETIEVGGKTYRRDEDTFDTWFSSGQWPYIVTDYLSSGELQRFYPTSLMETGSDLLDRWIARMIMLGLYATDKVPFKHVYVHGMVLDEKGQKMSKSKGNVINPMEVVGEFGSDAFRLGIIAARSAGQNQAFSRDKVVAGRNFANKLWNIARYVEGRTGDEEVDSSNPTLTTIADHWVVHQLTEAQQQIEQMLAEYRFAEASDILYHTIWHSVADWYLEAGKESDNRALLKWVLETSLKLAHPFMPFVTETIWQTLGWREQLLIQTAWPTHTIEYSEISAAEFERVKELVAEVRVVTKELGEKPQGLYYGNDGLIEENTALIMQLTRSPSITKIDTPKGLRLAVVGREAWLAVEEKTVKKHRKTLEERVKSTEQSIAKLEARLGNESYVSNAPEAVVNETRKQLKENQQLKSRLESELEVL